MKLRPLSDGCPLIRAAMAFVVNDYAMQDVDVQPFPAAVGYVYYADGRTLHFLCAIEAPSQEVAKQLVRESVPNEYCETAVVRRREPWQSLLLVEQRFTVAKTWNHRG
jgi:hypothetical protein